MDDMDDETRRRLEEEIVELQAQHEEALKTTFSSQKERRRELNRIKTAIRHRRKKITHPGLATKQRRIRRQQKREQRAMEENIRNRAHRDLDPLDLERSMASSAEEEQEQDRSAKRHKTDLIEVDTAIVATPAVKQEQDEKEEEDDDDSIQKRFLDALVTNMQNHLDTQSENVCLLLQEVRAEERSKQNKEKEEMEQKFAAEMEKARNEAAAQAAALVKAQEDREKAIKNQLKALKAKNEALQAKVNKVNMESMPMNVHATGGDKMDPPDEEEEEGEEDHNLKKPAAACKPLQNGKGMYRLFVGDDGTGLVEYKMFLTHEHNQGYSFIARQTGKGGYCGNCVKSCYWCESGCRIHRLS
jgi:hypothetical protein